MKKKSLLKNCVKVVITIILITILIKKIDIENLGKAIGMLQKEDLYISIAIYLISVELNAVKWKILLPKISILQLSKTCFKAQFYSMVLPGQLFGEASKVLDLKESNEPSAKIASSVIIDKITALIGMMAVGTVSVVFTSIKVPNSLRASFVIMLLIFLALLMSSRMQFINNLIVYGSYCLWKNPKHNIRKFAEKLYKLYDIWKCHLNEGKVLFISVLVGAINQGLGVFQVWMISNNMGLDVNYLEYCWIMPAVAVILLLPISFGGLGVREVSLSGFLALFGVASEKAIVISIVLLFSQIVAAIIGLIVIGCDWIKSTILFN